MPLQLLGCGSIVGIRWDPMRPLMAPSTAQISSSPSSVNPTIDGVITNARLWSGHSLKRLINTLTIGEAPI
jgi:hypothetical protein